MVKPEKIETVKKLKEKLSLAKGVYFADFQGMDVSMANDLRTRCLEAGVEFEVVKNTLTRRALDDDIRESLLPVLMGPTAIATSRDDEVVPAKILAEFMKEFEHPVLKAGLVDGRFMGKAQVDVLAKLPSRDVLLGQFAAGLKSPVQKLHDALSSPLQKLSMALKQVVEKQR